MDRTAWPLCKVQHKVHSKARRRAYWVLVASVNVALQDRVWGVPGVPVLNHAIVGSPSKQMGIFRVILHTAEGAGHTEGAWT